jgi:hypothetical protein
MQHAHQPGASQIFERGAPIEERPLRDLVSQLSRDGSLLVKQEIALAKQELADKADALKVHVASLAIGGVVLYTGVLTLTAGVVLLLAQAVAAWLSALLVGVALATVGAILLLRGKKKLSEIQLQPEQTMTSVRRDVEAVKEATRDT